MDLVRAAGGESWFPPCTIGDESLKIGKPEPSASLAETHHRQGILYTLRQPPYGGYVYTKQFGYLIDGEQLAAPPGWIVGDDALPVSHGTPLPVYEERL